MLTHKQTVEKIKGMTASEIIMAMLEGLRNPVTKIDMSTYGHVRDGVCFGCAATNAICGIQGLNLRKATSYLKEKNRGSGGGLIGVSKTSRDIITDDNVGFMYRFESCINLLRKGDIYAYNQQAEMLGIANISFYKAGEDFDYPLLDDDYTEEQLVSYENLAKMLKD